MLMLPNVSEGFQQLPKITQVHRTKLPAMHLTANPWIPEVRFWTGAMAGWTSSLSALSTLPPFRFSWTKLSEGGSASVNCTVVRDTGTIKQSLKSLTHQSEKYDNRLVMWDCCTLHINELSHLLLQILHYTLRVMHAFKHVAVIQMELPGSS